MKYTIELEQKYCFNLFLRYNANRIVKEGSSDETVKGSCIKL